MLISTAKKITVFFLIIVLVFMNASADTFILSDDGVSIEGNVLMAKKGSTITLTIVDSDYDWLDETVWGDPTTEAKIAYYDKMIAGTDGAYELSFLPRENGSYTVYLGNADLKVVEQFDIQYVQKTKFLSAFGELTAKDADVETLLKEKHLDLGLYNCIYGDVLINKDGTYDDKCVSDASDLIVKEVKRLSADDAEKTIRVLNSILLTCGLNNKKIDNLQNYKDCLMIGELGLEEYYSDDIAKYILPYLKSNTYNSLDSFNSELIDSTILGVVNTSDSTGTVGELIGKFADRLSVSDDTDVYDLVSDILEYAPYSNISALKQQIGLYYQKNNHSPGHGVSSGGGSGGGGGGTFVAPSNNTPMSGAISVGDDKAPETEKAQIFNDIENFPWAEESINYLYSKSVINGKGDSKFAPGDYVTREEFVKMLTLAFGLNLVDDEFPFEDVTVEHWSYPYVKSAYLAGICNGVSHNEFGIGVNITRQDVCVMVHNAIKAADLKISSGSMTFGDDKTIADYAKEAVRAMASAGIVNGDGHNFYPENFATRAEVAKIIYMVITELL